MSQLSNSVIRPSEWIVTECSLQVKVPILCHTYLDLILRSRVCNYLPVVDSFIKALVRNDWSEKICFFFKEYRSILCTDLYYIRCVIWVPGEWCNCIALSSYDISWTHAFLPRLYHHLLLFLFCLIVLLNLLVILILSFNSLTAMIDWMIDTGCWWDYRLQSLTEILWCR